MYEATRERIAEEVEKEYPTHADTKTSGRCNTQCHKITENLVKEHILAIINKHQ